MFCATSCVLSICLNLPKQVGENYTLLTNSKTWTIVLIVMHAILQLQGERLFQQ